MPGFRSLLSIGKQRLSRMAGKMGALSVAGGKRALGSLRSIPSQFNPMKNPNIPFTSIPRFSVRAGGRLAYGVGSGTRRAYRALPRPARRAISLSAKTVGVGAVAGLAGIAGARGMISGAKEGFMTAEMMYNNAHGLEGFGNETHFRNQGRMPSNHLSHSGIGLSMSRLRHG